MTRAGGSLKNGHIWPHGQGRGPAWTAEEDAAIRRAVRANRERGFRALERAGDGWRVVRTVRLADVARAIGRSVQAGRWATWTTGHGCTHR